MNLDAKIMFGKVTDLLDPEMRKMLVRGPFWSMIDIPFKFKFNTIVNFQKNELDVDGK